MGHFLEMQGHFFGNFLDKSYDNGYGNKIAIIQGIPFIIAWYDTKTILDALDINIVDKRFKIIFLARFKQQFQWGEWMIFMLIIGNFYHTKTEKHCWILMECLLSWVEFTEHFGAFVFEMYLWWAEIRTI